MTESPCDGADSPPPISQARQQRTVVQLGGSKADRVEPVVASDDEEDIIAWVRTELTADKPLKGDAANTD